MLRSLMLSKVEEMDELQLCPKEADTLVWIVFTSWNDM